LEQHLTIGIAGHVDHGKTSLVRCLTGMDTDRRPEEKLRGVSIEAGIAPLTLPGGAKVALVDVPGHTDYLKNTIRGLSRVDLAVLVVAADDSVMPQTREHLEILKFYDVRGGLVVISKADLVDEETLAIAQMEIEETLVGTFLEARPVITFSARDQRNQEAIVAALEKQIQVLPPVEPPSGLRLWIDQIRAFKGHGTVVSGTIWSGRIQTDMAVQVQPAGILTKVRSLQCHGQPVAKALAGQRVGVNLPKVPAGALERGMVVAGTDAPAAVSMLNTHLRMVAAGPGALQHRQKVRLHIGTAAQKATAVLMEVPALAPGQEGFVQLRLETPLAAWPRDRFVITLLNRNQVIGGGVILEMPDQKYRPAKAVRILPRLEALQQEDIISYVSICFEQNTKRPISAKDLALATGLPLTRFEAEISARVQRNELVYYKGMGAIARNQRRLLDQMVISVLESVLAGNSMKKNVNIDEIAFGLPIDCDLEFLQQVVSGLCQTGRLVMVNGGFQLPDTVERVGKGRREMMDAIAAYARQSGLSPFSADTIWKQMDKGCEKDEITGTLRFLATQGRLIRLSDNRFLAAEALEQIKQRVRAAIESQGSITLADSQAILGYGRWGGAPVLDYLDKIGFTKRVGNLRFLKAGSG